MKFATVITLLLVVTCVVAAQSVPPSSEDLLTRQAGPMTQVHVSIIDKVVLGFSHAKIPGGVVRIANCSHSDPEATINDAVSMKDLLDLLKLKSPEYSWKVDRGVVNVIPETGFPVPLDIPISDFHVKDVTALEAFNQLVNRSDLKAAFESRGLFQGLELNGGGFPISKARITLDLKNVSLLEVLNSIVRADGRAVWGYTLNPCQGKNLYQLKLLIY
jgi:hypothetical protein